MHRESKLHMRAMLQAHVKDLPPGKVLDIGSIGKNPRYRAMWEPMGWDYTGLDMIPGPNVEIVLEDPWILPIEDNSFDAIISGQMLEHNEMFWLSFMEMNRVLKKGGIMIHIAPSRGYEHRAPQDCWRFYRDGMFALGKWAGFEILEASTDWAPEHLDYFREKKPGKLRHINQTMRIKNSMWGDCVGVFRKMSEARDTLGMSYMRKYTQTSGQPAQKADPIADLAHAQEQLAKAQKRVDALNKPSKKKKSA